MKLKVILPKISLVLISIFSLLPDAFSNNPSDSIGLEKKGSRNYILHKVEPKETLYSIARKYSVSVAQVQESNAEIKTGISIGQIIRIPYKAPSVKSAVLSSKTHVVAPKETLFSIAKKYKISIEDLKRANPGVAMGLKKGQELTIPSKDSGKDRNDKGKSEVVAKKIQPKEEVKEETKQTIKELPAQEEEKPKKEIEVPSKSLAISSPPATVSSSYRKVNESGFANLMESSPTDLKYLALHKNAPVGTIIQVRNDENNQKIFVRVSGKLSGSDKAILKVSPKAYERLGAKGEKIPVSISYIP